MTRIKAAVCRAFGEPLTIEEVALRAPGQGEVEVEVGACAICHSDITFLEGGWGGTLPAVYGHETAGRVAAVGAGVVDLARGDTVVVTLIRACGHCVNCASGRPVQCSTPHDRARGPLSAPDGSVMEHGLDVGGFAERVVVDQSQVARVPASMPLASAALLACGVITGVGAVVNTSRLRPGQSAVVVGAGGVGLAAIQGARISGAARIVVIDTNPAKEAAAMAFGATDFVLAGADAVRQVRKLTGGGADACFLCVGSVAAYEAGPAYLHACGGLYMVGMPHSGQRASYEPVAVAATGKLMLGSKMGDTVLRRDIPWMVELYLQGRLKLDEMISGRWRLDQINEAIADTRSGSALRNVILF